MADLILALYYAALSLLAFYGLHRLLLVALYYRSARHPPSSLAAPRDWPLVTVQLPLFNERYVARRLIAAVAALDYPRDRLEVQVLDDSDDVTSAEIGPLIARLGSAGLAIEHLRRRHRRGYKAGALAAGLARARGELVAVFDADFVPPADFLRRAVPHFADSRIGMVQGCWTHLNRDSSLLTRVQAILLDGHFRLEHAARQRSGRFFNFNGTAGIWRRRAIEEAGGWRADTLTEDLDLSYRAQLAGWRFLFLSELEVPGELPVEISGFKRQQTRWVRGSIQTARKLLGRLLRSPLPWRIKLEAFVHLTNNASYPLMLLVALLIVPTMFLRRATRPTLLLAVDLPLFLAATCSVLLFYLVGQHLARRPLAATVRDLPALMGMGIGLAVSNTRAVLAGLLRSGGTFERTPKYRIESRKDGWRQKSYRLGRDPSWWLEGVLAGYFAVWFVACWHLRMWASLPFLWLFLQGFSYLFLLEWLTGRGASRGADGPAAGRLLATRRSCE